MAQSLALISDRDDVKYSYGDHLILINFYSTAEKEEIEMFVNDLISDLSLVYILVPYLENVYTSLPKDLHKYLFEVSETEDDDNYQIEDDVLNYTQSPKDKKNIKTEIENETKNLSLDDILDKINEQGVSSLNEQERIALKKYSN